MAREKLNIRLPTDEGPNPYDSKTKFEDLPKHAWAFKWEWWVGIGIAAIFMTASTWWRTHH